MAFLSSLSGLDLRMLCTLCSDMLLHFALVLVDSPALRRGIYSFPFPGRPLLSF